MNNKIKCLTNVKNILFEKFISWNQGNADKSFWELGRAGISFSEKTTQILFWGFAISLLLGFDPFNSNIIPNSITVTILCIVVITLPFNNQINRFIFDFLETTKSLVFFGIALTGMLFLYAVFVNFSVSDMPLNDDYVISLALMLKAKLIASKIPVDKLNLSIKVYILFINALVFNFAIFAGWLGFCVVAIIKLPIKYIFVSVNKIIALMWFRRINFLSGSIGLAILSIILYSYRFGQYREQIGFFKHLI